MDRRNAFGLAPSHLATRAYMIALRREREPYAGGARRGAKLPKREAAFAPTLLEHAGGPRLDGQISDGVLADAVERAPQLDVPLETAQLVLGFTCR